LLDLRKAVSAYPQASTTLVQVLRSTEKSTVDAALVAESLAYAALQGGAEHRKWLEDLRRPSLDRDPSPCVLLERDGSTLRIALNRPERRNAYSSRMRDELIEALELAAADTSVGQVDIRGNGPNFCSGGDLAEFGSVEDTASAHWIRMQRSAGWWMHQLNQRTVARVHGACIGAGVELPAFAGIVCSTSDATFGLPEVEMGLIPGAGGTASIPRRIGRQRTAWLALTGHRLTAKDALDWGLVDQLSDNAD
jgi:enoyl-CoA hydratase/carnithine racemase